MKSKTLKATIILVIIFFSSTLFAQPGGGGGGTGSGGPPPGTGAPIDAGAAVMLVGVASYAYYRLKENKENNN